MCSHSFETRSFPNSLAATLAVLPSMSLSQKLRSTSRFSHLCLARRSLGEGGSLASLRLHSLIARTRSLLCVDHSHGPCLRQLPSCVAVYPRDARSRRVLCRSSRSRHSSFLILRFRRNHRRQDAANALDHGFTSNLKHRTSNIPNVGSWLLL